MKAVCAAGKTAGSVVRVFSTSGPACDLRGDRLLPEHLGLALWDARRHCVCMSAYFSRTLPAAVAAAGAVLVIILLVRWWPLTVSGTVRLESFDGSVSSPHAATVCIVPRQSLLAHVRQEFEQLPARVAAAEKAISDAREEWSRKARRRDDAAKILRVAERSNASDLDACRAVYERAVQEVGAAYDTMERRVVERDSLDDPAAILAAPPRSSSCQALGDDGKFVLRSRGPRSGFFVFVDARNKDGASMVWLVPAASAPEVYDNRNVLTPDALRALAGRK